MRTGESALGKIGGGIVRTAVTLPVGFAAGYVGALIFDPGYIAVAIAAGALAGALGNLAGDATRVGLDLKGFSVTEDVEDVVSGAVGRLGGGIPGSAAYLGVLSSKCIPVFITSDNVGLIEAAMQPPGVDLPNRLYVMAPQKEAMETFQVFQQGNLEPEDAALQLRPGHNGATLNTITAHGMGRTIMASVAYGEVTESNYVRPVSEKLFAEYMVKVPGWRGGGGVKFRSCSSAYSNNAQELSITPQRNVLGSYKNVKRYYADTE